MAGTKSEIGHVVVSINDKDGEIIPLEVETFPENAPVAHVEHHVGLTVNLGNFESFRIDATVRRPCVHHEKAMETAAAANVKDLMKYLGAAVDASEEALKSVTKTIKKKYT